MALDQRKYERKHTDVLRDIRPSYVRLGDWMKQPGNAFAMFVIGIFMIGFFPGALHFADLIFVIFCTYFVWLVTRDRTLVFKMPEGSKWKDKNNMGPGRNGQAQGILYLGNATDTNEEIWFTNSDARTHVLYLGTTGSGKTEGLKSMVTNAMCWGSGFVYIDGKADTDLWSSLSSLVRRFGRDDDLLVLNYMTGNSDAKAPSNTMNPFSAGSASYLTNMLVELMPEAEGDNAMWKERAVALISSIMPALTWKRDHQDIPMSVGTIRDFLTLPNVIKLSRDEAIPEDVRAGLKGYLETLPGYVDAAFDDNGQPKPAGPDTPPADTSTPSQQHGYLSMQFTRALQSLADEYGYIFDTQAADVDMVDVVLNRRILVVLIPALEKSGDEIANLGKIVSATLKGMMGSSLGAEVEGDTSKVIENKPTNSATPFMTVFDEVGYYTAKGMAVMAAQARSLGFSLVYASQDLPALQKRVKEEARSITANCNIKIFGKLEDPTDTKDFFEKTVGSAMVIEASGFQSAGGSGSSYHDTKQAGLQLRPRASYDSLRGFNEGQAIITFGETVCDSRVFYSNPGHAKAMRVTRYLSLPPPDEQTLRHASTITKVRDLMVHKSWTAMKANVAVETPAEIEIIAETFKKGKKAKRSMTETGMAAVAAIYTLEDPAALEGIEEGTGTTEATGKAPEKPKAKQPDVTPAEKQEPESKSPPPAAEPEKKESPPDQTATAGAKEEPAQQKAPAGNPLAMFAKKKTDGDDTGEDGAAKAREQPDARPQKTEESGKEEASEAEAKKPQETAPPAPPPEKEEAAPEPETPPPEQKEKAAPPQVRLDEQTEKLLRETGENIRKALFKKKKDEEDIEAAE